MTDLFDAKVTQANKLVEAAHTLTLSEKRVILACVAQLDPHQPPPADGLVKLTAAQFTTTFGLTPDSAYDALADAAKRLYQRDIRRHVRGKVVEQMRWVWKVQYVAGDGHVKLWFAPEMIHFLTDLHRDFTSYQLTQVAALSSFYSIRFYELLSQHRAVGHREMTLDHVRTILELGDKYTSVKDLRRWVIDPSIAEINAQTDLRVTCTPQRTGRKIVGFRFAIDEERQRQLLPAA